MSSVKEIIARRAAKELNDGDLVNLGIGLPTMVANFLPEGVNVVLQSENGFVGLGPTPPEDQIDMDLVNAGGKPVSIMANGAIFDSSTSFGIIRGGHVDATILGALEVDETGSIANWIAPGKSLPGMGGAMDLVCGAKRVIVTMQHTNKGEKKVLKKCTLPLTAVGVVSLIVTEMGVMEFRDGKLTLTEINPEYTVEQVQEATEATLHIADDLKNMF